ncbi:hypothetical protein GYB22_11625 [bacterium]|nr:hypothetical protein [bacterium]
MIETIGISYQNFDRCFDEFVSAGALSREEKAKKLLSQVDILSKTENGMAYLYEKSPELDKAGIFENSSWSDPKRLTPSLVKGTLTAGYPAFAMEILSELRMLAYAKGEHENALDVKSARDYLEEVIVQNLEFAFQELTEETRLAIPEQNIKKIYNLFKLLIEEADLRGIKGKLAEELRLVCEQRPIVTQKTRNLIDLADKKFELDETKEEDHALLFFINAIKSPSHFTKSRPSIEEYESLIGNLSETDLMKEINELGTFMRMTGLASQYQAIMLLHVCEAKPELIGDVLALEDRGRAELAKHRDFVIKLIQEIVSGDCYYCIYGLSRMLRKGLFSRKAVRASINNIRMVNINSHVENRILKSQTKPGKQVSAKQYLIAATFQVLGQPLGIGQGNNATCQSARGISMWSQHAPAKLVNKIITVASQNNLIMRFENTELESNKLAKGLIDKLDYNLDAVSAVLVPHLDKIYNEMMRRASGRFEDPHKWVNPALYGEWMQVGFASAYSYLSNSIQDYRGFIRLFYATFHLDYNGGKRMVYPNPIGIFITSKSGAMLGFHAISLLRIARDPEGEMRAYFLNPNNEGRQNWGQDIKPSVHGFNERHGESSLPFKQLAARVYAFHFNILEAKSHTGEVPEKDIDEIEDLAKESWGKSYNWSNQKKQW